MCGTPVFELRFELTASRPPEYRVRLFLSADLSGSTAFKTAYQGPISWVPKFKHFYSEFLAQYTARYSDYCLEHEACCGELANELPKLWKTVGDEVIFVNRVSSCAQIFAYVHAFIQALEVYSRSLKKETDTAKLDVKGNGWIASFPYPNQTVVVTDQDVDLVDKKI